MRKFRAKVFVQDGNRFLMPGCWYDVGSDEADPTETILDSMMLSLVCGATLEPEWLEVDTDDEGNFEMDHVEVDLVGRQFAHGAVSVMVIGGPMLEEARARTAPPEQGS